MKLYFFRLRSTELKLTGVRVAGHGDRVCFTASSLTLESYLETAKKDSLSKCFQKFDLKFSTTNMS